MIETTTNTVVYTVADSPVFAYPYAFFEPSDLHCAIYDGELKTDLVPGVDYTVESKADYSDGANVTLLGTLVPGSKLAIVRELPLTQKVNLPEFGKIPSAALEKQLDRQIMIAQFLKELLDRAMVFPPGATVVSPSELLAQLLASVASAGGYAGDASAYAGSAGNHASVASACMVSAGGYASNAGDYAGSASACMVSAGGYAENASSAAATAAADAAASAAASAAEEVSGVVIPPVVSGEVSEGAVSLILSGGKAYRFDRLVSSMTIQADDNTRGDTVLFPAHPAGVSCSVSGGIGCVDSGAFACIPGAWNYLQVRDGTAEVRSVSYTGISSDYGCRLTDSAGTSVYSSGDILSGTTVTSNRGLTVGSRGFAVAPVLTFKGSCTVHSGGRMLGGDVSGDISGGSALVRVCGGGTVSGGSYYSWGVLHVSDGGNAFDPVFSNNGWGFVSSGGTATGTVIFGGHLRTSSGGTVTGTVISGGGVTVYGGGLVSGIVLSGGTLTVSSGGTVTGLVSSGGSVVSSAGAVIEYA